MTAYVRGVSVEGRAGSEDAGKRGTYRIIYKVRTDDINDGQDTVGLAFGLPKQGDLYILGNDFNPSSRVVGRQFTQIEESPYEWEVEILYEPFDVSFEDTTEVSLGFQTRRIVVPGRYNDPEIPHSERKLEMGIVSSNGELFDPPPEMEVSEPVLTFTRNETDISIAYLMSITNTVNKSEFYGADARTLRMMPPQAQRQTNPDGGWYWRVTYQLAYKYDTWDLQILNTGRFYMTGGTMDVFQKDGVPFVGLLTTAGAALNSSSVDTAGRYISDGEDPTFQRLRVYREIDFGELGLF